jgi:hypothetical protein
VGVPSGVTCDLQEHLRVDEYYAQVRFSEYRHSSAHANPGRDCGTNNACVGAQARRRKRGQAGHCRGIVVPSDWELRGPIRMSALPTLNERH